VSTLTRQSLWKDWSLPCCQNCLHLVWGNNPNAQGLKGKWKSSKRQCSRPNCCQRLLKYAAERNFANNLLDESEFDQVSSYGGCVNPRVLQQVCFQDFFLVSCLPCFWPYHPDTVIFFISGCALIEVCCTMTCHRGANPHVTVTRLPWPNKNPHSALILARKNNKNLLPQEPMHQEKKQLFKRKAAKKQQRASSDSIPSIASGANHGCKTA
jgi:hypothetical protein